MLLGLAEGGADVTDADLLVGTSAGSAVASQLDPGADLQALFDRHTEPVDEPAEDLSMERMARLFGPALASARSPQERRAAIGRVAMEAETLSEAERRAVLRGRLRRESWPGRALRIVVVDAATGEPRIIGQDDGVDIVDAVAASCAVPGVWPTVTIDGHRYMDGGVRSLTNADVALGHDVVLVLAPFPDIPGVVAADAAAAIEQLRATARTLFITPDAASLEAIGPNPLDPATRGPAAAAGRAQGRAAATAVRDLWTA